MSDNSTLLSRVTSDTPLNVAIQAWKLYLADKDRSPYTIKAFVSDLNLLASYLPPDYTVGIISTNEINLFLEWLQKGRGKPCSPKTLARRITSIKSFFRWLHGNAVIISNPSEKVIQHSVISPLPTVLTLEEEAKVIDAANQYRHQAKSDPRPYTLLTLLLLTGVKKGECLGINLNHLDLESPTGEGIYIRYANPNYRYKERKINLNEDWVQSYKEYIQQYKITDQLFPWSPRRLEYILEDIGKKAEIEKHLSFDMCRWTSVLRDWQNGLEPEKIRIKLGVSKIQFRELKIKLQRLAHQQTGALAQIPE